MKIFDYTNYTLTLHMPEILLVREFKQVLDKDKSKEKEKAFSIFQYGFLVKDFKSPYKDYTEDERITEALKDTGLTEATLKEEYVKEFLFKYQQILDSNRILRMISSVYRTLDELEIYFKTVNFTEKVEHGARKGTLLYDPLDLLKTIKEVKTLIDTIKHLEQQAREELSKEDVGIRGDDDEGLIMSM